MKNDISNSQTGQAPLRPRASEGQAAMILTIVVLFIGLLITSSFIFLGLRTAAITRNLDYSVKSYYVAEGGIEDLLLRSRTVMLQMPASATSTLIVGEGVSTRNYTSGGGGSQTYTSEGDVNSRFRTISVSTAATSEVEFNYGVQVGDLGLSMDSTTRINGNVYSNGEITGSSNARIFGDAFSAGAAGRIRDMSILLDTSGGGGNAYAHFINDSGIDNDAFGDTMIGTNVGRDVDTRIFDVGDVGRDVSADSIANCTVGRDAYVDTVAGSCTVTGDTFPWGGAPPADPTAQSFPITDTLIDAWKAAAAAGGTILGYTLGGNSEDSLGPKKIDGNMTLTSNAILKLTGTIWVTGDLRLESNVIVYLDPGYGGFSEVMVVDGKIFLDSNITLCGSEGYKKIGECNPTVGSYIMLLSTNDSINPDDPAISSSSNTKSAILYAQNGMLTLTSNAHVREATGYGIHMDSNAELTYEAGLADALFSGGPSGGQNFLWEETY